MILMYVKMCQCQKTSMVVSKLLIKLQIKRVINSSYKPCDVEAMMAMEKDTVCKWFHNSVRKHVSVKSSRLSFAQDGGGQKQNAPQISFCDGCLYSEVAAGKASRKASTVPVVANVDHSESVVLCSNMKRVICSKTSQPDIVDRKNVGNVDKVGSEKMKLYDINGLQDKYINSILIWSCHDRKNVKNCNAKLYKMWKSQTDFKFGFIPLGEFQLSDSSEAHVISDYCPIKAHAIVKSFQKPNYLGARLKVDSQLNLEAWKAELHDYWDSQLIDLLHFGFPLNFNQNSPLR